MSFNFLILALCIIPPIYGLIFTPYLTKEIFKDIRPLRILHYVLLTLFGFELYINKESGFIAYHFTGLLKLLIFCISLIYAAIFAIVTNNIEDLETDKISNTKRPLVKNTINQSLYKRIGVISLLFALLITALTGYNLFLGITFISLGYYIYSCKPFRLKRVPFLAKFILGLNSLIATLTGFSIAGGSITKFPSVWMVYILIPLSLSANFVDLKDIEGDRIMNVKTFPVIFGEKKAIQLIALMTIVAYLLPAYLIGNAYLFIPTLLMLCLHLNFLNKKPYNETPIFTVYLCSIMGLIIFHYINK